MYLLMDTDMNFEQARLNMIEQQIRTWEVLDQNVLNLIGEVHREDFIPAEYRQLALADVQLPLAHDQVTMTPKVEARILQALNIQKGDNILEIGTGCGYLTALLASSGQHVTSIDIYPEFTRAADIKLAQHGIYNVSLETGDAINGWAGKSPYDVVVVTGSVPLLETCFQEQLKISGRLFVIAGVPPVMEALLITRAGDRQWATETLFETDLPPLIGARKPQVFTL